MSGRCTGWLSRQRDPSGPALFGELVRAIEIGADDVAKPFDPRELLARVKLMKTRNREWDPFDRSMCDRWTDADL